LVMLRQSTCLKNSKQFQFRRSTNGALQEMPTPDDRFVPDFVEFVPCLAICFWRWRLCEKWMYISGANRKSQQMSKWNPGIDDNFHFQSIFHALSPEILD
jgi:hypothetical protein